MLISRILLFTMGDDAVGTVAENILVMSGCSYYSGNVFQMSSEIVPNRS